MSLHDCLTYRFPHVSTDTIALVLAYIEELYSRHYIKSIDYYEFSYKLGKYISESDSDNILLARVYRKYIRGLAERTL